MWGSNGLFLLELPQQDLEEEEREKLPDTFVSIETNSPISICTLMVTSPVMASVWCDSRQLTILSRPRKGRAGQRSSAAAEKEERKREGDFCMKTESFLCLYLGGPYLSATWVETESQHDSGPALSCPDAGTSCGRGRQTCHTRPSGSSDQQLQGMGEVRFYDMTIFNAYSYLPNILPIVINSLM